MLTITDLFDLDHTLAKDLFWCSRVCEGPSHPHHPPIPPFLSLSPWSGGDHFRGLTKKIRDPRP